MSGEFATFKSEFTGFRTEMHEFRLEMHEFRLEMHEFRLEMREAMAGLNQRIDRVLLAVVAGQFVLIVAIVGTSIL